MLAITTSPKRTGREILEKVRLDQVQVDASLAGTLTGLLEAHGRRVDAGDAPPFRRKPDGVAAWPATDVDGVTWRERSHERLEGGVRRSGPGVLGISVVPDRTAWRAPRLIGLGSAAGQAQTTLELVQGSLEVLALVGVESDVEPLLLVAHELVDLQSERPAGLGDGQRAGPPAPRVVATSDEVAALEGVDVAFAFVGSTASVRASARSEQPGLLAMPLSTAACGGETLRADRSSAQRRRSSRATLLRRNPTPAWSGIALSASSEDAWPVCGLTPFAKRFAAVSTAPRGGSTVPKFRISHWKLHASRERMQGSTVVITTVFPADAGGLVPLRQADLLLAQMSRLRSGGCSRGAIKAAAPFDEGGTYESVPCGER